MCAWLHNVTAAAPCYSMPCYPLPVQVEFFTSTERGAGTDANVSFKLIGAKGESTFQRVVASKEAFERGSSDKFVFRRCVGNRRPWWGYLGQGLKALLAQRGHVQSCAWPSRVAHVHAIRKH